MEKQLKIFLHIQMNLLSWCSIILFHISIASPLLLSYNKRLSVAQKEICPKLLNQHSEYYNGTNWLPVPDGDLKSAHSLLIEKIRSHRSTFVEVLTNMNPSIPIDLAEAAIEMNGEYFISKYRSVLPCKSVGNIERFEVTAIFGMIFSFLFAVFIYYYTVWKI